MKLILSLLMAAGLAASALGDEIECGMKAGILMEKVDATHVKTALAIMTKCSDGDVKVYRSREALMDTTTPKEIGALIISAMAHEVGEQLRADGAMITDQDILEHAQLVEVSKLPPPTARQRQHTALRWVVA